MVDLSRRDGVTIFISTHFMNEAERCDRISLMHAGKVLDCDTPANLTKKEALARLKKPLLPIYKMLWGMQDKGKKLPLSSMLTLN